MRVLASAAVRLDWHRESIAHIQWDFIYASFSGIAACRYRTDGEAAAAAADAATARAPRRDWTVAARAVYSTAPVAAVSNKPRLLTNWSRHRLLAVREVCRAVPPGEHTARRSATRGDPAV